MISSSTKFCIEAEVCLENKLDLGGNSESSDGQVENSPIRQACDFIAKGQEDLNVLKLNRNSEEIKLETIDIIKIENIKITRTLSILSNSECYKSKAFDFFYHELGRLKDTAKN